MPAKRRRAKAARKTVSARACEIFQADPQAIVPPVIVDAELARELERPALLAQADIEELIEQLSA
jgi:predicted nucleic acid-binding protein